MQRVDAFYLYTGGSSLKPLANFNEGTKYSEAQIPLYVAQNWLRPVIAGHSVFKLRTSWSKGNSLLTAINNALAKVEPALTAESPQDPTFGWLDSFSITSALTDFEIVLAAEWALADLYLVSPLPGYDTTALIENANVLFPANLHAKVPETFEDANEFGRCIAFRLPTAAGFHLHRINEAVLKRYYDVVAKGKPKPRLRTIGGYLEAFRKHGKGDAKVMAALDSLRELHRNPLMHPEQRLESVDEAISLYGAVQSVVVHMLKALPPHSDPEEVSIVAS